MPLALGPAALRYINQANPLCPCYNCYICDDHVTILAKPTYAVRTKTEINFITTVDRHTQYLSFPSASSVKC